jgi:hypothetical protein
MWIRTKDRFSLVNINEYNKILLESMLMIDKNNYVIITYKDKEGIILGAYSSKDNAIDALAYIQECIYLGKAEMNMPLEKDGELLK